MTKPEIVSLISEKADISKKAATVVLDAIINAIHDSLSTQGGRIRISDLGTFRVVEMNARRGVNPRTGEDMIIPPMRLPRFTPSKSLREAVNTSASKGRRSVAKK
jgi:DNA-binding protein HU-beta